MKVVFLSNYFNHHQKPLADALYGILGADYHFIETEPMEAERKNMGWGQETLPGYVRQQYDPAQREACAALVAQADVAVYGSAPYSLVANRIREGKLTFKYAERRYKKAVTPVRWLKHLYWDLKRHLPYKNLYYLTASGFAAADYAKTLTFWDKVYRFGYFTALKTYENPKDLLAEKTPHSILWVARLIPLKHPESCIALANALKTAGYSFQMTLIGSGPMEQELKAEIRRLQLEDCVSILGFMSPEEVRSHMERSELFLFTSNRQEGWGAVVNEAMNSACVPVSSNVVGVAPFLIRPGENGLIFEDGNWADLYQQVKYLLDNPQTRQEMGLAAYETMQTQWNADNAARRLLTLSGELLSGKKKPNPFDSGVCSRAPRIDNNWYKGANRG